MSKVFDLFIIGGGINGAGIARDAAGRGLSVCLADKGEIGGATSCLLYTSPSRVFSFYFLLIEYSSCKTSLLKNFYKK